MKLFAFVLLTSIATYQLPAQVSGQTSAQASVEALVQKAASAYKAREFDAAGIAQAQTAADAYGEAANAERDTKKQAVLLTRQAEVLHFLGTAYSTKGEKIKYHLAGLAAADKALLAFGVSDVQNAKAADLRSKLSAEDLKMLADALYNRGINLGQWGSANGVSESLGRWPELRANMQLVIDIGHEEIASFGPARVIGRGFHQIPGFLGGSNREARKYLQPAFQKTLATGQIYSTHGSNNLFYAELLRDTNKADEGKAILEAFVKADASTLNPELAPEVKKAQRDARDLLRKW